MTCPQCQVLDGHSPSCARASIADDLDIDADELLDDEFVDDEVTALSAVPEFADNEKTPTRPPGSCWRCEKMQSIFVVGPHPGIHEALLLPTCRVSQKWAWCPVTFFLRLGEFELYLGPDRRDPKRIPFDTDADRRRVPPTPPREDDA